MREVVGDRLGRLDGGDGVLEQHVIGAALVEDQREAIEVLDPPLELAAVHHPDGDGELLAPHVVEEDVLDVGLRDFDSGPGISVRLQPLGEQSCTAAMRAANRRGRRTTVD